MEAVKLPSTHRRISLKSCARKRSLALARMLRKLYAKDSLALMMR
jgi:hypothetical protein